jgi:hypothetical protein
VTPFASVLTTALRVGRILDDLGIPYYVGGSVASSILGEQRFTNDVDLAVLMTEDQVAPFAAKLGPDFAVDELSMREEIRRRGSWNIIDLTTGLKIDLFFFKGDSLDRTCFARRRSIRVNDAGDTVCVATVEDMILRKILWFLAGGEVSERQWRDIVQMIRISGQQLDNAYLDQWADWLDIQKWLSKARDGALNPPKPIV